LDPASATLFLKALVIGVSIAAPVGPIGLLTINRTLEQGMRAGLATGLGAAFADAAYAALGAFGVTIVVQWLLGARAWLAILGGAVLMWMAWRTWRRPVVERAAPLPSRSDLLRCFGGTFLLTLSNPATIVSFVAIFGALAGGAVRPVSPWIMVLGVLAGSALWWLLLSMLVASWRHRFSARWRKGIDYVSAAILAAFAAWQWYALWASRA